VRFLHRVAAADEPETAMKTHVLAWLLGIPSGLLVLIFVLARL